MPFPSQQEKQEAMRMYIEKGCIPASYALKVLGDPAKTVSPHPSPEEIRELIRESPLVEKQVNSFRQNNHTNP